MSGNKWDAAILFPNTKLNSSLWSQFEFNNWVSYCHQIPKFSFSLRSQSLLHLLFRFVLFLTQVTLLSHFIWRSAGTDLKDSQKTCTHTKFDKNETKRNKDCTHQSITCTTNCTYKKIFVRTKSSPHMAKLYNVIQKILRAIIKCAMNNISYVQIKE